VRGASGALALALGAAALAGCAGEGPSLLPDAGDPDRETCEVRPGGDVAFDHAAEPCRLLSSYRFFADGAAHTPNDRVIPFEINTALFSDYAAKRRFFWLPEGSSMTYREAGPFDLPVGAVILKSFSYPEDLRSPEAGERMVETRLLIHGDTGWRGEVYVWNQEQTEAYRQVAGGIVSVSWIHSDGATRKLDYIVPNINQCKNCHVIGAEMAPIAPQARHLNRDHTYPGGAENQLAHLADRGYLVGAPADPEAAPRAPVFDDPETGTVEDRTRAWLDVNCAHCHNPGGPGRTSGLDLAFDQESPSAYGVCKTPVAAGAGSGGRQFGIVPGDPDDSILLFRIESTRLSVRMPELLRQTVHEESAALVRAWIEEMEGDCAPPPD
jgi:uncharacterized repeat protein (TIGR03806 family)